MQQKLDECPDRPPDGDCGKDRKKNPDGTPAEEDAVSAIFEEALPDLPQMMVDPFGNYLFQKLFVKIDDHQRLLAVRESFMVSVARLERCAGMAGGLAVH